MKQDKNFTIRLKASIERKLKETGIKKHGIWPPDEFDKPDGEKAKWWKFMESLNDITLEQLQGESPPSKEEGYWKQRCEAAEQLIQPPKLWQSEGQKEVYRIWQQLKSQPPH